MKNELLRKNLKSVKVVHGTAEKMGVEREWNAVICAQIGFLIFT
jgi:hypothetical protein